MFNSLMHQHHYLGYSQPVGEVDGVREGAAGSAVRMGLGAQALGPAGYILPRRSWIGACIKEHANVRRTGEMSWRPLWIKPPLRSKRTGRANSNARLNARSVASLGDSKREECNTIRRTEPSTQTPSLSSRSRNVPTWARANSLPRALRRSSCINT